MKVLVSAGEELLHKTLDRWGYEIVEAADGNEALQQLCWQKDPPKLAILNSEMEGLSGPEICKSLRGLATEPYIYIILLANNSRKDDILETFEHGADDCLPKPFDLYELRSRLIVARRILELQDRLITMRESLRAQATHDSLTGLCNRQASMDALAVEIDRADRENKPFGLIMADLDHFKHINDAFGHLAGDAVLKAVATKLKKALRPYDTVGRYGGEEFLIVAPGCDATTILNRAETLRAEIGSDKIRTTEGDIPVTMSMGAIAAAPGLRESAKSLLRSADEALYRAKRVGRNRVELVDLTTAWT